MVFIPQAQPHAQSLFLFPIVFGINLIQFFDGKNKLGLGIAARFDHLSWVFDHSSRGSFERGGTKPEGEKFFGNGKCELIVNFSATMVTSP